MKATKASKGPKGPNINTGRGRAAAIAAMQLIAANVAAIEGRPYEPVDDGSAIHDRIVSLCDGDGRVVAANASLLTEGYYSEKLTNFSSGFRDAELDAELGFFAPGVETPRRFEYSTFSSPEEFYSDTVEDLRAIGGDFPTIRYTEGKTTAKTQNRGLKIIVDLDEVSDKSNWRQQKTAKVLRRLKRNQLRRAIALLSAAATNTAVTWDKSAGKDPDQDVLSELVLAATASGVKPNRVGYGDTAWSKRMVSHRAQTSAGGFSSASLSPEQLAGLLGVDKVLPSKARYSNSGGTMAEVVANLVLMFFALENADEEDASNVKLFWTPCEGGERYRVYERQISAKLFEIAVEHFELLKITSTLGMRKFTVG